MSIVSVICTCKSKRTKGKNSEKRNGGNKMKKTISTILAATFIAGAMGAMPAMAEDNPIVYTYINEVGETVNVTQNELDVEHWDTAALGDTAPVVYKDFPMSIEKFVSDIGELSLDLVYMKHISDFSRVNLRIEDLISGEEILNCDISQNSFYSPTLKTDALYLVVVTEELNGEISEYKRIVKTEKSEAEMPAYVYEGTGEQYILIGDIDTLKSAQQISENGEIIIDTRVKPYDRVKAEEFDDYCGTLENGHSYRVFAKEKGEQYSGFIDGNDNNYIYDYTISVSDYDSLYNASTASVPSSVSLTTVVDKAVAMGFEDYTFKVKDGSTDKSKYAAFKISLSDYLLADIDKDSNFKIRTTIRGDVSLGVYMWIEVDDVTSPLPITAENGKITRGISTDIKSYGATADSVVTIYGAVYFPTATVGNGMVTAELLQGYTDDVTGSMYSAIQDTTTPAELPNFTEYNINGGVDVDAFYLKNVSSVYKVSIRNRSVEDQNKLESGTLVKGSREKYLSVYSVEYSGNTQATNATNVISAAEEAIYTVPKNADLSAYCAGSNNESKSLVTVRQSSLYSTTSDNYQISYVIVGNNGAVEED